MTSARRKTLIAGKGTSPCGAVERRVGARGSGDGGRVGGNCAHYGGRQTVILI